MKKNSANWYVAATHFLTAGFVVPFICNLIFVYIGFFLVGIPEAVVYFIALLFAILSIWIGVIYSAKYITRVYAIRDIVSVINLSTIYLVVIRGIYVYGKYKQIGATDSLYFEYSIISLVVSTILFYLLSKKYINKYYSPQVA